MRIRTRLTILFSTVIAVLLLLSFILVYYVSERYQKEDFYEHISAKANSTADLLIRVNQIDSTVLKTIDVNKKDILEMENISVYNEELKEIYTSNDSLHFYKYVPDFENHLKSLKKDEILEMESGEAQLIFLPYSHGNKRYIVVASAIDIQGKNFLKNLRLILIFTYFIILFVIIGIGWILSGRALSPISNVISDVTLISGDSLSERLKEGKSKDEIDLLIKTFNQLLTRIEEAVRSQKLFVSNASHELRNPLAAITSQLEVALLNKRSDAEYEQLIRSVLDDIKGLNAMSHRLLQLSKLESGYNKFHSEIILVDELLWEIKNEFKQLFPQYEIKLIIPSLPDDESLLRLNGNKSFLHTCLINLFENSCKFSTNKTVNVELIYSNKEIKIRIQDNGFGISNEELPHIFEPFYRAKKSMGIKGHGIGLSIVKKIVDLHGGEIQIDSKLNVGTTFTLIFPTISSR